MKGQVKREKPRRWEKPEPKLSSGPDVRMRGYKKRVFEVRVSRRVRRRRQIMKKTERVVESRNL